MASLTGVVDELRDAAWELDAAVSQSGTVRVLTKQGSIVRTSPAEPPSRWPPLVFPLTSTEKPLITWFLLTNTRMTSEPTGSPWAENGAGPEMWFTLNFQEPARAPERAGKLRRANPSGPGFLAE